MSSGNQVDLVAYRALFDEVVNRTLRRGSVMAVALAWASSLLLGGVIAFTERAGLWLPTAWTAFCGAYALAVWILARAGRLRGAVTWIVMLGFTMLPTGIYVAAAFMMPSGTATYVTGPPSYLFFFVIVVTGLAFDSKLSALVGVLSAVEYVVIVWVDHEHLAEITAPDPFLLQDLTTLTFYFFKAMMMAFTGLVVGIVATNAQRLIVRVAVEEQEKRTISRLFGELVSPEVREKIIGEKAGLGGERVEVAVLFSDLRSFTSFSERHEPEEVVRRLNRYFDEMVAAITERGGVVDKFIGDSIMAVFGGVIPLENPCEMAFQAALGMRDRLRKLNESWIAAGLEPFDSGIGIHFGVALQGTIGSRDRKEFTVVGDTVNTAARIEGLCKDQRCPVLVSEAVVRRLTPESQGQCSGYGEVAVKGKSAAVRLWGAHRE